MNRFEVEIDALRAAKRALGNELHQLRRHVNAAEDLIPAVPPNTDPKPDLVANKMSEVYGGKATEVMDLLQDYVAELEATYALIDATEKEYIARDHEAAARIRGANQGEAR